MTGEIVWNANGFGGSGEDELFWFELVRLGDVDFTPTVGVLIQTLDQDLVSKRQVDRARAHMKRVVRLDHPTVSLVMTSGIV